MPAVEFLDGLYRVPGLKSHFDGISLHPYAVDAETLEEYVEEFHEVTVENRDRVPLYITEMGWGSETELPGGRLRAGPAGPGPPAARLLQLPARKPHAGSTIKQVHWFSWKDIQGDCNFCDSVGLFREGRGVQAEARLARLRRDQPRPRPSLSRQPSRRAGRRSAARRRRGRGRRPVARARPRPDGAAPPRRLRAPGRGPRPATRRRWARIASRSHRRRSARAARRRSSPAPVSPMPSPPARCAAATRRRRRRRRRRRPRTSDARRG